MISKHSNYISKDIRQETFVVIKTVSPHHITSPLAAEKRVWVQYMFYMTLLTKAMLTGSGGGSRRKLLFVWSSDKHGMVINKVRRNERITKNFSRSVQLSIYLCNINQIEYSRIE